MCTALTDQANQVIIGDGSGGAIVVWEDHRSGNRCNGMAKTIAAVALHRVLK